MSDVVMTGSAYGNPKDNLNIRGINKNLAIKWRSYLPKGMNRLFKLFLRKEMKYFGYM